MSNTYVNDNEIESVHIPRNYFYRPRKTLTSMEMGKIYPTYASLLIPNDLVEIDEEIVVREMPTLKPTFSDKKLINRWFVVALRNLDKNFYRFMTGYKEYSNKSRYEEKLKKWKPSNPDITKPGELWDMLGYPVNCIPDQDSLPNAFWKDAYNYIYDLYFRNETIEDSILIDGEPASSNNENLLTINKDRDFFTTALPWQQLGDPIALPLTGNTKATWLNNDFTTRVAGEATINRASMKVNDIAESNDNLLGIPAVNTAQVGANVQNSLLGVLNKNTVSMENISSVFISELRFAFAMQLFQEMQARGGIRDNEFLLMHFGVAPTDETLGRPRYLGGTQINILTEEVLQTSQTTQEEPLGQIAGHGLAVGQNQTIRYHAKEFAVLLCLSYIKTDNLYGNQGMQKEFSLDTLYDFPLPIFSHLSEQPIFKREILCASEEKLNEKRVSIGKDDSAAKYNAEIFGYRPVYDWLRHDIDKVHGLFNLEMFYKDGTDELAYKYNLYQWSEAFFFDIRNGKRPALNTDFNKAKYDNRNYSIIDNTINKSQFLCWFNRKCNYFRPATKLGTPGRIDHII